MYRFGRNLFRRGSRSRRAYRKVRSRKNGHVNILFVGISVFFLFSFCMFYVSLVYFIIIPMWMFLMLLHFCVVLSCFIPILLKLFISKGFARFQARFCLLCLILASLTERWVTVWLKRLLSEHDQRYLFLRKYLPFKGIVKIFCFLFVFISLLPALFLCPRAFWCAKAKILPRLLTFPRLSFFSGFFKSP